MIHLIVVLAILGLIVWAITAVIPMPDNIKRVIYVVGLVFAVLMVLNFFFPGSVSGFSRC